MTGAEPTYLRGTLELLILKAVSREPLHGYGIAKWVAHETDGVLELEDAALYQGLHRMEDRGLLEAEWGVSETGRRAKLYHPTEAGRRRLSHGTELFRGHTLAVLKLLEA